MTVDTILRRELLVNRDLKIVVLARKLHVSRVALSRVLNGQSVLSIPLALNIEEKFGLNARDLLVLQLEQQIEEQRELNGQRSQ